MIRHARSWKVFQVLSGSLAVVASVGAAEIVTVESVTAEGRVVLGGTVVPYKEVTLSAQVPGRVEFLAGEEGDSFEASQVLVAIDDDDILAKRRQLLAQLANAEAALRNSQVQYSRELWSPQSRDINRMPGMGLPGMFDQFFTRHAGEFFGFGSPGVQRGADLYSQGIRINQAQAAVLQARAALEEMDAMLRDTRSVAPFDGVIMSKLVEVGDTVQPGQPLLVYAHTKYLRIQAEVPARLVPYLELGMLVPAYLDVGRTQIDARVSQIFPLADPTHHTVTVKFDLPIGVPGGPGMYAEVMVPDGTVSARPSAVIPKTAIIKGRSLPSVLVVPEEGPSVLRVVRLGASADRDRVIVLSGVRPGERVIDNPPPGASAGWMP